MQALVNVFSSKITIIILLSFLVACGGSDSEPTPPVPDANAPVITLNGEANVTLFLNDSYTEQGATAVDDRDGTVEVVITGSVDTSNPGTYTISYSATDNAGNNSSVERTVNVVLPPDTTAPVITLNGEANVTLFLNDSYTEQGATATDNTDGTVEVVITGNVDTSTLGTYTITYSATDNAGNSNSVERVITIIAAKVFITTWQTDNSGNSNDDEIKITTFGDGYNYRVEWGDGTVSEGVTGDITHTYASTGRYTVTISGDFPQLYFPEESSDAAKLTSLEQWGTNQWRSMHRAFAGCLNLVSNAVDIPDLSNVTDMSWMFYKAEIYNQDISGWDVNNVTDMSLMFLESTAFNQDIGSWDVNNVKLMRLMFPGDKGINK
jgi:major membrane immunogen (membrane-anchored lipoprotein)